MTSEEGTGGGPDVGAVVINYNGGARTLDCLAALRRQSVGLSRIVVVDNGSEDGSPDAIRERFPEVEVLELGENRGLPAARNVGLGALDTELVLLSDSDIYLEPDALAHLVSAHEETGVAVVCPRIRLIPERDVVQADGAAAHFVGTMVLLHAYTDVEQVPTERRAVGGCIGACYLVDRRTVIEAGGFDETYFFYFEDLEFMLRLSARGEGFVCEPAAVAFHDRGEGTAGLSFRGTGQYPLKRAYLSMRHRLLTILIHYRLRTLLVLAPALATYELAVAAFAVSRGWTIPWLKSWGWHFRNLRLVAQRRRSAQAARVVSDRDLLVGGPLPLAPGVIEAPATRVGVAALSGLLNGYWRIARRLI
ncbi:MAG: glycosyltransferase family 2 protein [Gemmatimonadetes bacterium]|nr:glycosyltransferase family 2 protein [Gemmatimonadota bacterium]